MSINPKYDVTKRPTRELSREEIDRLLAEDDLPPTVRGEDLPPPEEGWGS